MKKKLSQIEVVNVGLLAGWPHSPGLEFFYPDRDLQRFKPEKPEDPIPQILSFLVYRKDQLIIIYSQPPTPQIQEKLLYIISCSSSNARRIEACTVCGYIIELWEGEGIHDLKFGPGGKDSGSEKLNTSKKDNRDIDESQEPVDPINQ